MDGERDYHELNSEASHASLSAWTREVPQPKDIPVRNLPEPGSIAERAKQVTERDALVLDIAMVCHEANRAYCIALGDFTQRPWSSAPDWQRESAEKGVRAHLKALAETGDVLPPHASHESWLAEKERDGWKYGAVKNETLKTHPCFVPYESLPAAQQRKDHLFAAIVKALAGPL